MGYISLCIQSYSRRMIEVSNQLRVFRFHYHSQKVIGSLWFTKQMCISYLKLIVRTWNEWLEFSFWDGSFFRGFVSFREGKYNMRILLSRKHVWINNWRHKCPLWWGLNPWITWIRRLFCQKEVDWFQVCICRGILWCDFPFVQRFGDII